MRKILLLISTMSLVAAYSITEIGANPARALEAGEPKVAGHWAGTWGLWNSGKGSPEDEAAQQIPQRRMECDVTNLGSGKWQARFEGDCGRPYDYTITMQGRQVGEAVLFSGTVDLGEQDGGIYDWIGQANGDRFVGFYTSQKYVGTFHLTRP